MGSLRSLSRFISQKPLFFLIPFFLITRLTHLTRLPIYADEANYLDWGWRALHQPNFLFYSLYDAKQPLLIWLFGFSEIIFSDPLFSGRLVTVVTGLITLIGIYHVSLRFTNLKTANIAVFLYTIVPLFLFFDRQALMETPISAVGIWTFYLLEKFLSRPNLKHAGLLGLVLAIGIWIKNSSLLFLLVSLTLIGYHVLINRNIRFSLLTYTLVFLIIGSIILAPLFFQPSFWGTFHLNGRYSLSLSELIKFPVSHWFYNLTGILDISFFYLTPFIFLASIYGIYKLFSSQKNLVIWTILPLLQVLFTTRTLNIRYPASFLPALLIFAAYAIHKNRLSQIIVPIPALIISFFLLWSPPTYFNLYSHVSSYSHASDYVTGQLTGYLVNDLVSYLKTSYPNQPIFVTFAVNSGNFEAALIDYFHKDRYIKTAYLDARLFPPELNSYNCLATPQKLFFIARENQTAGLEKFLVPVDTIYPSHGSDFATIYTLKSSDCQNNSISINPT